MKLKPLTLLFGANSAGKSTILHALHYAREVFERHNLDADHTVAGGHFVDLGGFGNFVHTQNLDMPVRLSFHLDLQDTILPDYGTPFPAGGPFEMPDPLVANYHRCQVHAKISWSHQLAAPYVGEYAVWLNDEWIGVIEQEPSRVGCTLRVNLSHPSLLSIADVATLSLGWGAEPNDAESGLAFLFARAAGENAIPSLMLGIADGNKSTLGTATIVLDGQEDALPRWGQRLSFPVDLDGKDGPERNECEGMLDWILETVSQLMVGPGQLVRDALAGFRYLGPLREAPARNQVPPRFPDPSRWASGLGAWDRLETAEEEFVDAVSYWLGDSERLNSGYFVRRKRYKELDLASPLVVQLLTGRAFDDSEGNTRLNLEELPTRTRIQIVQSSESNDTFQEPIELQSQDVGIGISQVVPVIVTALDGRGKLLAIEQPELHLHPKLQAELADLFIEAALGTRRHLVLLETHSELIPLRMMRRIRETAEGTLPVQHPEICAEDVAVYYVESFEGATVVTPLELGKQGQLIDPWPNGFFEEGYRERFSP